MRLLLGFVSGAVFAVVAILGLAEVGGASVAQLVGGVALGLAVYVASTFAP